MMVTSVEQAAPRVERIGPSAPVPRETPTIWGLSPVEVHDRYWVSRRIQVVRPGDPSPAVNHADLYLLIPPQLLTLFPLRSLRRVLGWRPGDLTVIRLHAQREHGFREMVVADDHDRFVRVDRIYDATDIRCSRIALTPRHDLAEIWRAASDPQAGWRELRAQVPRRQRRTRSLKGNLYTTSVPEELVQCMRDLTVIWRSPQSTISRARIVRQGVWGDPTCGVDDAARFVGNAWIGAGRVLPAETDIVGPVVLWDEADAAPDAEDAIWPRTVERIKERPIRLRAPSSWYRVSKRAFDVAFALLMLAATLPFYPLVMLAIWLNDGTPFFFRHERESMGGRIFRCVKFRSMHNDVKRAKEELVEHDTVDGPHIYITPDNDPRVTAVGRFLRKYYIDELPQFINVLRGQMSVVGPRPSPRIENQGCPPWREARLSVRPGITGLWQVKRTREHGLDFQEWIQYDIEYVENVGWSVDLFVLWRTALMFLRIRK